MRVSIIVPMLNEAPGLPGVLARLTELERQGCEILIVDGGSDDGSVSLAERAGFRVLASQKGRARQMNLGAGQATGDVLLFLHADTQLPPEGDRRVAAVMAVGARPRLVPGAAGGGWRARRARRFGRQRWR